MSHWDSVIEARQRPSESRRRVALDEHAIRLKSIEDLADPRQGGAGQIRQVLIGSHQVEVPVRLQIEQLEDLRQHFAVLPGDTNLAVEVRPPRQFLDDWCELDRLGPCPENKKDLHAAGTSIPRSVDASARSRR